MSIATGSFRTAAERTQISVHKPDATIHTLEKLWLAENVKTSIRPGTMPAAYLNPLRMLNTAPKTASGFVRTCCDQVPIVCIPGMPARMYPMFARDMIHFTLASFLEDKPELMCKGVSPALLHLVTVSTLVRVGTWASLGTVPDASVATYPKALRWSDRKQKIQLKAAELGDGTAQWRLYLATFKGFLVGTTSLSQVLAGLAPILFVLGGAHVLASGETYASHYVEKEVRETLSRRLDTAAMSSLVLKSAATWDILVSAGLTGFTSAFVVHIAKDPAFILGSQIRAARSKSDITMLTSRLAAVLAGVGAGQAEEPHDMEDDLSDEDPFLLALRGTSAPAEDTESVADTVDLNLGGSPDEIDDRPMGMRSPGIRGPPIPPSVARSDTSGTPRPHDRSPMTPQQVAEIRDALANAQSVGPRAESEAAGADPDETVQW